MLFCQLGQAKSLREICGGLAASEGKLRHLGVPTAPSRSTLAYANEHRPWRVYEAVFYQLLAKCQALAVSRSGKQRKFRFKSKLLSLDATVIDLCASLNEVDRHLDNRWFTWIGGTQPDSVFNYRVQSPVILIDSITSGRRTGRSLRLSQEATPAAHSPCCAKARRE
jgi:hypothetical protein